MLATLPLLILGSVLCNDPPAATDDGLVRQPSTDQQLLALSAMASADSATTAAPAGVLPVPTLGLDALSLQNQPEAKPPATELERWSGNFALGATFTDGNSTTKNASATAELVRRGDDNRLTAKGGWLYAEQKVTTATGARVNNITDRWLFGSGQYDHFMSKKWYAFLTTRAEGSKAPNLTLRWTSGAGLGHQIAETEELALAVEAGVSYVHEDYGTTAAGAPTAPVDYVAARVANTMKYR